LGRGQDVRAMARRSPRRWWRAAPAGTLIAGGAYLGYMVVRETARWAIDGAQVPWDTVSVAVAGYFVALAVLCIVGGFTFYRRRRSWFLWSALTVLSAVGAAALLAELTHSSHWGGAAGADYVELCVVSGILLFAGSVGCGVLGARLVRSLRTLRALIGKRVADSQLRCGSGDVRER